MTRKLTPEEKLERYQTRITYDDLAMAVADIQRVCCFSPKLSTKGNMNSLRNTIRSIAGSLHPNDSKVFHTLTNWVLYRMEVIGWQTTEYKKPSPETLLDLKVASKVYTKHVLPTYSMNNYDYPYDNVFLHTDADDVAWCVNQLMYEEKYKRMDNPISDERRVLYQNIQKHLKYIQYWCQLYNFDIRLGIDLRTKKMKRVYVDTPYDRLRKIEAEEGIYE